MSHPLLCIQRFVHPLTHYGYSSYPIHYRCSKNTRGSSRSTVTSGDFSFQHLDHHLTISNSIIPTRYFLGRPDIGEEMHISIEQGKTLIIRLMAVGPVVEGHAQRDVWFEVNGEVSRARQIRHSFLITITGTRGIRRR
jgi:hypothetical protein